MARLSTLSLSALTAVAMMSGSALAQQKSLKDQLVGTWNITAVTVDRPDGTKLQPFGANPKGVIMFTSDGHFVLVNTRPGRSKFASNNRLDGTPDENKATTQGSLAYFGTYTVDEAGKTYSIRIDAGSFPNDEGTEQKRPVTSITADELKFTNPTGTVGGAPAQVTAKRAK
jgi:lipocalin-like protein